MWEVCSFKEFAAVRWDSGVAFCPCFLGEDGLPVIMLAREGLLFHGVSEDLMRQLLRLSDRSVIGLGSGVQYF